MAGSLFGYWKQYAAASGTVTLAKGAQLIQLRAHSSAGGTVVIFGGPAIPIITGESAFILRFDHGLAVAPSATPTIVFTGTDSYFVEAISNQWDGT